MTLSTHREHRLNSLLAVTVQFAGVALTFVSQFIVATYCSIDVYGRFSYLIGLFSTVMIFSVLGFNFYLPLNNTSQNSNILRLIVYVVACIIGIIALSLFFLDFIDLSEAIMLILGSFSFNYLESYRIDMLARGLAWKGLLIKSVIPSVIFISVFFLIGADTNAIEFYLGSMLFTSLFVIRRVDVSYSKIDSIKGALPYFLITLLYGLHVQLLRIIPNMEYDFAVVAGLSMVVMVTKFFLLPSITIASVLLPLFAENFRTDLFSNVGRIYLMYRRLIFRGTAVVIGLASIYLEDIIVLWNTDYLRFVSWIYVGFFLVLFQLFFGFTGTVILAAGQKTSELKGGFTLLIVFVLFAGFMPNMEGFEWVIAFLASEVSMTLYKFHRMVGLTNFRNFKNPFLSDLMFIVSIIVIIYLSFVLDISSMVRLIFLVTTALLILVYEFKRYTDFARK